MKKFLTLLTVAFCLLLTACGEADFEKYLGDKEYDKHLDLNAVVCNKDSYDNKIEYRCVNDFEGLVNDKIPVLLYFEDPLGDGQENEKVLEEVALKGWPNIAVVKVDGTSRTDIKETYGVDDVNQLVLVKYNIVRGKIDMSEDIYKNPDNICKFIDSTYVEVEWDDKNG